MWPRMKPCRNIESAGEGLLQVEGSSTQDPTTSYGVGFCASYLHSVRSKADGFQPGHVIAHDL